MQFPDITALWMISLLAIPLKSTDIQYQIRYQKIFMIQISTNEFRAKMAKTFKKVDAESEILLVKRKDIDELKKEVGL